MKFIKRKAFTLIEIAVIILVIGVLLAGVAQALEMFAEASLKSARNLSKSSRLGRVDDLTIWFDATSEKAFDKEKDDGSAVSIWKDSNPRSNIIISSTSSLASLYPSYTLSAINSLPAVSFKKTSSSVGNCVTVPNESFVNSSEDFTLYLIYNPKTLDDGIILEKNNATATTFPFSLELLSGSYKFSVKNSAETISVTSPKQAIIKTPNLIRLSRIKGSQIEIVIDGVSTTQSDTLTSSTLNNAELSIGCRNGSTPANFISGDFGETAFFNRNVSVKEKADIEEYLYKKWKMKKFEGTLPANCSVTGGVGYTTKTLLPIGSSTFSCDAEGYAGTINYNCPSSGGTATISGSCTANTCSLAGGAGYSAKSELPVGLNSFPCDAGYTGTISYNCPSSGGTATKTGGSCTMLITCTVPNANTNSDGNSVELTTTATSLTCKTGFFGSPKYTCTGTGTYLANGIPCAPIKCYAIDRVGLGGTNYFDSVINGSPMIHMYTNASNLYIETSLMAAEPSSLLPLVDRLKVYDVYHGSLSYSSSSTSSETLTYGAIDVSKFSQTSYTSKIIPYNASNSVQFDIYGSHILTKYARLLNYGTNNFNCDSGFTGTLTYNCQTDGSTLNPTSGTCVANTCTVSAGTGYSAKSELPIGSGSFSCDEAGYGGTISYTCPSSGGAVTNISGSCTSAANTCSLPGVAGYSAKSLLPVGSASFPCDEGYSGTIYYTCPSGSNGGTATITSGSCTASTVKCYAKDKVGLSGTNYVDVVTYSYSATAPKNMYIVFSPTNSIGGPKLELDNSLGQEILPYVNRLKLNNNVYHGSLTFLSQSFYFTTYSTITTSASITTYPLFQYFIPENSGYKVKGTHAFTKYARILGYGTSITVNCDPGFTGTLTYSCTVDGSALNSTSGVCTAN